MAHFYANISRETHLHCVSVQLASLQVPPFFLHLYIHEHLMGPWRRTAQQQAWRDKTIIPPVLMDKYGWTIFKSNCLNPGCLSTQTVSWRREIGKQEEFHHKRKNSQFYSWKRRTLATHPLHGPLRNGSSVGQRLTELPGMSALSDSVKKCHWTVKFYNLLC